MRSPRARCPACQRAACFCAALRRAGVPLASAVALLILQHPREQREPKGTARLLHLAVAGSRLQVGALWPVPPALSPLPSAAPGDWPCTEADGAHAGLRRDVLLYPATPDDAALPGPPPLTPGWLAAPQQLRLVVIDGTWRKARRMLYDSPWLQSLPRYSLHDPAASRYLRIRRARGAGQLSTFEAAVWALSQLQPGWGAEPLAALWSAFDAFVEQQQGRSLPSIAA